MSDVELRVHDLERDVQSLKDYNKERKTENKSMREELDTLLKLTVQIKYLLIGAVSVFVISNIGLVEFLKKMI